MDPTSKALETHLHSDYRYRPRKDGPFRECPSEARATVCLQAMNNPLTAKAIGALLALSISTAGATPDVNSGEYFNQPYLAGINVVPAWNAGLLGAGVVVADLDSGIRATHVDLVGKIAPGGYDFVNDDDDPFAVSYTHLTPADE